MWKEEIVTPAIGRNLSTRTGGKVSFQDNFFTSELYHHYLRQGKVMSEEVIETLNKSEDDLTVEEQDTYRNIVLPARESIKEALAARMLQTRRGEEGWRGKSAVYSQSIIGRIAGEVLSETEGGTYTATKLSSRKIPETEVGAIPATKRSRTWLIAATVTGIAAIGATAVILSLLFFGNGNRVSTDQELGAAAVSGTISEQADEPYIVEASLTFTSTQAGNEEKYSDYIVTMSVENPSDHDVELSGDGFTLFLTRPVADAADNEPAYQNDQIKDPAIGETKTSPQGQARTMSVPAGAISEIVLTFSAVSEQYKDNDGFPLSLGPDQSWTVTKVTYQSGGEGNDLYMAYLILR
jgi:hypothetical protein